MAVRGDQEKTEAPTQRRREDARRRGQVARSREVPSAMVLVAGTGLLAVAGPYFSSATMCLFQELLQESGQMKLLAGDATSVFTGLLLRTVLIAGPFIGVVVIVVVASNLAQVGFLTSTDALAPKWSRLNPIEGFRRIFSLQSVVELAKGLLKLGIVAWVLWRSLKGEWEALRAMGAPDGWEASYGLAGGILRIGIRAGMVLAGLALLDYLYQRWEHERSLRMTKEELKEEFRQREGDPKIRARIRQRQREMARRRMMASVPKADVVITNPQHLAVALQYDREKMSAPMVVAKGAGYLAERIKEIARRYSVEVIENKPLAQALYKMVDVGAQIPPELYRAVAEILAYLYRKRGQAR